MKIKTHIEKIPVGMMVVPLLTPILTLYIAGRIKKKKASAMLKNGAS